MPGRDRAYRIVAGLFGAVALLITLVTMATALFSSDPAGKAHRFHNTAGGVGFLLLGILLLVCARWPATTGALAGVCAAGAGSLVGGLIAGDLFAGLWFVPVVLAVVLVLLSRERSAATRTLDLRLLLLGAIALVPTLAYALTQGQLQRTAHDIHSEAHHYGGMAVAALIVPMVLVAASLRTPGWRLVALLAAGAAVLGGVFSIAFQDAPSAPDVAWAWVAIAWAVAVAMLLRLVPVPAEA